MKFPFLHRSIASFLFVVLSLSAFVLVPNGAYAQTKDDTAANKTDDKKDPKKEPATVKGGLAQKEDPTQIGKRKMGSSARMPKLQ